MQQRQWLTCKEPSKMLAHLGVDQHWGYVEQSRGSWIRSHKKDKIDRKLRLFACACCRHVWDHISYEEARTAVEIAEHFADGKATGKQLEKASSAAARYSLEYEEMSGLEDYRAEQALMATLCASGRPCSPLGAAENAAEATGKEAAEREVQCDLLRDVFGNPFRTLSPEKVLRWPAATTIALAIYEGNTFNELPILADALEDAGCTEDDILTHCRGPGPHVRGCWVLDWLLNKK